MDPRAGSEGDQECIFLLLTHTKKLLLVSLYDPTAETGVSFQTDGGQTEDGRTEGQRIDGWTDRGQTEGQTDVEVEIVI